MKNFALIALLAPMAVALAMPAVAEETVVIKHKTAPGHSALGHEQWQNGRAIGHEQVVVRRHSDDMTTGSVVKKKVIHRTDDMGGHSKTVIKKTTTDD